MSQRPEQTGTNGESTVFEQVARRRDEFSVSGRNVADLILTLPDLPLTMSMRALARRAGVSDATVLRFCRLLGFGGYSDFKLAIARSTALGGRDTPVAMTPTSVATRTLTIAQRVMQHAESVIAGDNLKDVEKIVERIAGADIVYIFAFGASTVAAWDFMHQLHYFGLKASVLSDPHLQALRVAGMTEKSVALFLSIGYSRLLSEMAEAACDRGAFTAAVATPGTPLSSACHSIVVMTKDVGGTSGPPVLGRYLQLLILDTVAEEIAARLGRSSRGGSEIEINSQFNY